MFAYWCDNCGLVDSSEALDAVGCRCGRMARRRYSVNVNRSSLKSTARWDPVVGAYVENDRQFRSLLAQGQDEQAEKLQMDVKLQTVDARDHDALDSLHGHDPAERQHLAEQTAFVKKAQ